MSLFFRSMAAALVSIAPFASAGGGPDDGFEISQAQGEAWYKAMGVRTGSIEYVEVETPVGRAVPMEPEEGAEGLELDFATPDDGGRLEPPAPRKDKEDAARRDRICRYLYDVKGHEFPKCMAPQGNALGSDLARDFERAEKNMGEIEKRERKAEALRADISGPCPGPGPLKEKIASSGLSPISPNTFAAWAGEEGAKHADVCLQQFVDALCYEGGELEDDKEARKLFEAKPGFGRACNYANPDGTNNTGPSPTPIPRPSPPPKRLPK